MNKLSLSLLLAGLCLTTAGAEEPEKPATKPGGRTEIYLDSSAVRGNKELPRMMYILPWQESEAAKPGDRPVNSLISEVLAPLDREVFLRKNRYFEQLYRGEAAGPGGATAGDAAQ